jgi:hypothetical protein
VCAHSPYIRYGIRMKSKWSWVDCMWFMLFGFLSLATHIACKNGVSCRKGSVYCGFMRHTLWLLFSEDFKQHFERNCHEKNSVCKWHQLYEESDCIYKGKIPRKCQVPEVQIEAIRAALIRSPNKSVWCVSQQLNIPSSTVQQNSLEMFEI